MKVCTVKLSQQFRDLYHTLDRVNADGATSWDRHKITIDRRAYRAMALKELSALVREATKQIAKI